MMRRTASFSGHTAAVYSLAWSGDPSSFLSGGGDGRVIEWSLDQPDAGTLLATLPRPVFSLFAPKNSALLLAGTDQGGLHVLDLNAKSELQHFAVHRQGIFRIIALPDGRLVCAGGDGTLSIWAITDTGRAKVEGERLKGKETLDNADPPSGFTLSPSAFSPLPSTARLTLQRQIPISEQKLRSLALSSDGALLAVGANDGKIRVVDARSFNEQHTLSGHAEGTTALAFHPAKPVLLSGGKDGYLRAWRTDQEFAQLLSIPAHGGTIYRIAFDPKHQRIATASRDKTIKIWDAHTLAPLERLDRAAGGHTHSVNDLLWLQDTLVTSGDDKTIRAWER